MYEPPLIWILLVRRHEYSSENITVIPSLAAIHDQLLNNLLGQTSLLKLSWNKTVRPLTTAKFSENGNIGVLDKLL